MCAHNAHIYVCVCVCVHGRFFVGSSTSWFLPAVSHTHLSVHYRAYCNHKQISPSLRLRLAVTGDAGYEMPAAIAHRQISDDAQAASEEINYTIINTGTRPSRWHSPWASAGKYVAHEQPNQLSGGRTSMFNQSSPLDMILSQLVPSISHLDDLFRQDQYIFLSIHFLSFKWLLCKRFPFQEHFVSFLSPCPSVFHTVRVPKLILLCSTTVCFDISQKVKFFKEPNWQSILCALLSLKGQEAWTKCQMWQVESLFHDGPKFVRITLWNAEQLLLLSQWHIS